MGLVKMYQIKYTTDINPEIYHDSLNIRTTVFVKEQNVPEDIEIDKLEDHCAHFVLYDDQTPMATARFFVTEDNGIHVQRVAVLKEYRQKHLGSKLLKYIFDFAKKENYQYVILGAQDHAQMFYTKLGFKVVGEQYKEAGILHHDMKLEL